MFIIASLGLFINIIVAVMLFKGSDTENDLNMRGAFLHVISDLLGSVGAIIAALCIYFFAWNWADSLASVLVAILVLRSGVHVAIKASHILMQGTPEHLNPDDIQQKIFSHNAVLDVHDVHIWSLTSKRFVLTCHIVVDETMSMQAVQQLLHQIEQHMSELGIEHVTIQTETKQHQHNHDKCSLENIHQH